MLLELLVNNSEVTTPETLKKEKTLFRVPPAIVGRLKVRGQIAFAVTLAKCAVLTVP